jgi:hypothetical protein
MQLYKPIEIAQNKAQRLSGIADVKKTQQPSQNATAPRAIPTTIAKLSCMFQTFPSVQTFPSAWLALHMIRELLSRRCRRS